MEVITNFFQIIKEIFTNPSNFFDNLKKEEGMQKSLLFYFIIILIINLIGLIIGYLFLDQIIDLTYKILNFVPKEEITIGFPRLYSESLQNMIQSMIWVFIGAGILHIWFKIFGGKASYQKTFQLYVYSHVPEILLGLLPILGMILWIWTMVLLVIGSQKTHKLTKNKAILIIVIPYILINVIVLLITFFSIAYVRNIGASI